MVINGEGCVILYTESVEKMKNKGKQSPDLAGFKPAQCRWVVMSWQADLQHVRTRV